jgi:hypothetical protein
MCKFTYDEVTVLDAFHIVGSELWMLWGITLKVYEYIRIQYLLNYLYV